MATRVPSFAKINLGLSIGPVRPDGFHELATVYQTVAAHDLVTVSATPLPAGSDHQLRLTSNDERVPLDERNTVARMLTRALVVRSAETGGGQWAVAVDIEKRLPVQGGLGAGSGNAAAALIGFERETGFLEAGEERFRIAAEVGSDVPLFLLGGTVLGHGRGELVTPLPDLLPDVLRATADHEVLLALPEVGVSTPEAFRDWDRTAAGVSTALTQSERWGKVGELSRALAVAFCEPHYSSGVFLAKARGGLARHPLAALVRTGIRNDFEEVVFRQHPFLGTIKRALMGLRDDGSSITVPLRPARYAALSGSGSALFGVYDDAESADQAERRLEDLGVRSLRTRFLGRAAYWEQVVPSEHPAELINIE